MQLCFNCSKACGLCSWSKQGEPVKGSQHIPRVTEDGINTFEIVSCPEYEYDGQCLRCPKYNKDFPKPELYQYICKYRNFDKEENCVTYLRLTDNYDEFFDEQHNKKEVRV